MLCRAAPKATWHRRGPANLQAAWDCFAAALGWHATRERLTAAMSAPPPMREQGAIAAGTTVGAPAARMSHAHLELVGVSKRFGPTAAVDRMRIAPGQNLRLPGLSGIARIDRFVHAAAHVGFQIGWALDAGQPLLECDLGDRRRNAYRYLAHVAQRRVQAALRQVLR